jgi:hypothetical protein
MKYTIEIYSDIKILNVRLFGELYTREVALMDREIRLKAREMNCKIVFDFRETRNYISITDAYYWFDARYNKAFFNFMHVPVVYITNERDESFFYFFEITSKNKGAALKICKDEISAFQWLEKL